MKPMDITLTGGGIHICLRVMEDGDVLLLHCSPAPFRPAAIPPHTLRQYRLVQVQALGEDQNDHHGSKHTGCEPGLHLRYRSHQVEQEADGTRLTLTLAGAGLEVLCLWAVHRASRTLRTQTVVQNRGSAPVVLTYVSAFALTGLCKGAPQPEADCLVHFAYNSWCSELQWRARTLADLGLAPISDPATFADPEQYQDFSLQAFSPCGRGTWSTSEFLPMGALEDQHAGLTTLWQVEADGPWQWELSTLAGQYYLLCAGADDERHHWRLPLSPGETYRTPAAALTMVRGGLTDALACLNDYRRTRLRPCEDDRRLPVIFNDYMALLGDPTEAKLLPLIQQAAALGGEYFCIDSGWYAAGSWWDTVGAWQEAPSRFPHGLRAVTDAIRAQGMIPGLWVEIEVMGVNCDLAHQLPDSCFFLRGGKRVIDHGRYQLDFACPQTFAYATEVAERLIADYGVGYLKIDYNINAGYGTERDGQSAGVGLMRHQAAYRAWLQGLMDRHPALVVENCASGGMRMSYGLLSLLPVQSLSDQDEPRRLAPIACAAPSAVTPEQAACWSLPHPQDTPETVAFSMVSTMLGRIHQSGDLASLPKASLELIREAIACYKTYRERLPKARPFWPLGLPGPGDQVLALGMDLGDEVLLSVWHLDAPDAVTLLPLPRAFRRCDLLYPASLPAHFALQAGGTALSVRPAAALSARLYRLR